MGRYCFVCHSILRTCFTHAHLSLSTPTVHSYTLCYKSVSHLTSKEARLNEQRKRDEADRLEALKHHAGQLAKDKELKASQDAQREVDLARALQEHREEERRQREAHAQSVVVEQNSDVLNMLKGGV